MEAILYEGFVQLLPQGIGQIQNKSLFTGMQKVLIFMVLFYFQIHWGKGEKNDRFC